MDHSSLSTSWDGRKFKQEKKFKIQMFIIRNSAHSRQVLPIFFIDPFYIAILQISALKVSKLDGYNKRF